MKRIDPELALPFVENRLPSEEERAEVAAKEREFHDLVSQRFSDKRRRQAIFGSSWSDDTGVQIKFYDNRMVTQFNGDSVSADIWVEDEVDICFQILPKGHRAQFLDFELARTQIDRVMARVFQYVPNISVEADFFGYRTGEIVARQCDPADKGRDMFSLRMHHLNKRPNAADYVVDAVVLYDEVLTGKSSSVQL